MFAKILTSSCSKRTATYFYFLSNAGGWHLWNSTIWKPVTNGFPVLRNFPLPSSPSQSPTPSFTSNNTHTVTTSRTSSNTLSSTQSPTTTVSSTHSQTDAKTSSFSATFSPTCSKTSSNTISSTQSPTATKMLMTTGSPTHSQTLPSPSERLIRTPTVAFHWIQSVPHSCQRKRKCQRLR